MRNSYATWEVLFLKFKWTAFWDFYILCIVMIIFCEFKQFCGPWSKQATYKQVFHAIPCEVCLMMKKMLAHWARLIVWELITVQMFLLTVIASDDIGLHSDTYLCHFFMCFCCCCIHVCRFFGCGFLTLSITQWYSSGFPLPCCIMVCMHILCRQWFFKSRFTGWFWHFSIPLQ